jgi:hypothetical protein
MGSPSIAAERDEIAARDLAAIDGDPIALVDLRPCVRHRIVWESEDGQAEDERETTCTENGAVAHAPS